MNGLDWANRYPGRWAFEWPTWAALAGCYAVWGLALAFWDALGPFVVLPAALSVAFHSSLQHEVLHGHPTRNAVANEALVCLPVGLAIPYRRFRDLHLKHHNDDRLTDPYDDPESFYVPAARWAGFCAVRRALFLMNATFLGRLIVGPALAMYGFWRSELSVLRAGDARARGAWVRHLAGLVPLLAIVHLAGVPVWAYVILAAYPGMSLIMVRSYIEHRAVEQAAHRTAVVEAALFWRLLFLNNNYHSVHHCLPSVPWYQVGGIWLAERDRVLETNGGYLVRGYGEVLRRWGLRPREPVVHPDLLMRRPTDRP